MNKQSQALYVLNTNLDTIDLWDALHERLSKANSLAQFVLIDGINDQLNKDLRHYLWALSQFLQEACEIQEALDCYQKKAKIE